MNGVTMDKLTVLGEGAKYDVSCSSSGADRSNIGRIGSTACAGVCHSWTADGRCISLLKILLSNDCAYDCKYCVNRRSADVARRSFEPRELADLTIEFYRRNYIEGLFLSSAVLVSPDHTTERMYECLWILREEYGFAGYVHAKILPGVSPELVNMIGLVSDRLSVNIEFPSEDSLARLAPQKRPDGILGPMRQITETQAEYRTLSAPGFMGKLGPSSGGPSRFAMPSGNNGRVSTSGIAPNPTVNASPFSPSSSPAPAYSFLSAKRGKRGKYRERFAPAGQTTQMIVGASGESDLHIIRTSEALYHRFSLKRVYFSAYIPVVSAPALPDLMTPPPLKREHRLYQADWLLRFYGFRADEILSEGEPDLDYELDPKVVWALRHLELFPIEINKAPLEELLRIPGVGNTSATRITRQRREAAVRYDDLKKMGVALKRAKYFLTCSGRYYGDSELEPCYIRDRLTQAGPQANPRRSIAAPLLDGAKIRSGLAGAASAQISMFEALAKT
ncbi:MAG: putative DNA modification/repair radical SAM protein [Clostridiales Family XIII bacterium]|jgi:putative DNA modification/repair radical SAM protein|nr:putative DNA modification/repair radical SAM protein [Clostridiales Family XIII bacterium]